MKKIFNFSIKQILELKEPKQVNKRIKLPELKPDTFEKVAEKAENTLAQASNDMETMLFKEKKFKLYPEDLEKLKQLPEEERPDFMLKLHQEGRYIEINE